MTKDDRRKNQENWVDSALDMDEFREWDVKKQLEAIAAFAKTTYSFQEKFQKDGEQGSSSSHFPGKQTLQ